LGRARYIEHIHDDLIAKLLPETAPPGPEGIRDLGLLESAVARPFQSAFGADAYPTIILKAIALFHSLVSNHPFRDGNKRTAVVAFNHFLYANRFWHFIHIEGVFQMAIKTASYRERGLTHAESIREIETIITPWRIPLSDLRQVRLEDPSVADLYDRAALTGRRIRRDKRNRLIPSE
jgi:death on curing protein